MNTKNSFLIGIVLVLAGVYVVYFTDWFRPNIIQISHINRPAHAARAVRSARNPRNAPTIRNAPAASQLIFGLGKNYSLTEIKVVPLAAFRTNRFALPVWHVVSDSNSAPLHLFFYGRGIRGMHPAVAGSRPGPIQPGVVYRLFVTATKGRGQHDFQIGVAPSNAVTNR